MVASQFLVEKPRNLLYHKFTIVMRQILYYVNPSMAQMVFTRLTRQGLTSQHRDPIWKPDELARTCPNKSRIGVGS